MPDQSALCRPGHQLDDTILFLGLRKHLLKSQAGKAMLGNKLLDVSLYFFSGQIRVLGQGSWREGRSPGQGSR
jgi:hypothetical protein